AAARNRHPRGRKLFPVCQGANPVEALGRHDDRASLRRVRFRPGSDRSNAARRSIRRLAQTDDRYRLQRSALLIAPPPSASERNRTNLRKASLEEWNVHPRSFEVKGGSIMSAILKWAFVFLIISVIAAVFGFGGVAEGSAEISRVLFFIFIVICVL